MSATDIQPLDAADYPDLSERQLEALPIIFAAPTLKAGLEAADIPKSTWYLLGEAGAGLRGGGPHPSHPGLR